MLWLFPLESLLLEDDFCLTDGISQFTGYGISLTEVSGRFSSCRDFSYTVK